MLQGLAQTAFNWDEGEFWPLAVYVLMVPLGAAIAVLSRVTRVEATGQGLRIVKLPSKVRLIRWQDVADIRRDPPNAWATKLIVMLKDGDAVALPLPIKFHQEVVERWKLEMAGKGPIPEGEGGSPNDAGVERE